jgi:hypothetical protein
MSLKLRNHLQADGRSAIPDSWRLEIIQRASAPAIILCPQTPDSYQEMTATIFREDSDTQNNQIFDKPTH